MTKDQYVERLYALLEECTSISERLKVLAEIYNVCAGKEARDREDHLRELKSRRNAHREYMRNRTGVDQLEDEIFI